jgi:hypothetical protein
VTTLPGGAGWYGTSPNLNAKIILGIVCLDVNRLVNFSQECQASEKYFSIAKCLYMAST